MKLLFDFFPVALFFIAYKWQGIFFATSVAVVASLVQVIAHYLIHRQLEKMHIITFLMMGVLGGATLFFRDPTFIQWKPTAIYWTTALIFLGSHFFSKRTLIQKMMEANISLPQPIWHRLNLAWVVFFTAMGAVNIYIFSNFDMNIWVNFKLFGGLGATLIFVFLQSIYLAKHVVEDKTGTNGKVSTLKGIKS